MEKLVYEVGKNNKKIKLILFH